LCELFGGTTTVSPAPATISSPFTLKAIVPDSISNRSVWYGCVCAAATKPFGCTVTSTSTYSPFVSADVSRNSMRSPVTGFSITSPLRIISRLLAVDFQRIPCKGVSGRSGAAASAAQMIRPRRVADLRGSRREDVSAVGLRREDDSLTRQD
jgi:hypothetical protein